MTDSNARKRTPATPADPNGRTRRTASADRQRPVLAATVPAALKRRVEREAARRGLPSVSAAVEQLLEEALSASDQGRRGDAVAGQLQLLRVQLNSFRQDQRARNAALLELTTTLIKSFLAHTPPPAEGDREQAKRSAMERYERLIEGVRERVASGDTAMSRLMAAMPTLEEDGVGGTSPNTSDDPQGGASPLHVD